MGDSTGNQPTFHWQFATKTNHQFVLEFGATRPKEGIPWAHYEFPADVFVKNLNTWHFVAVNFNAAESSIQCWIDGNHVGTQVLQSPAPLAIGPAVIGNWSPLRNEVRALNGAIDELAIWNRSLSADEIQALYYAGGGRPPATP